MKNNRRSAAGIGCLNGRYTALRAGYTSVQTVRLNSSTYQLRLGRQRQVWLIPIADERVGVQVKL